MAAKRSKKKRKGGGQLGLLRWLVFPIALGLAALAGYLLIGGGIDPAAGPQLRRAPVASSPDFREAKRPAPTPVPVVVSPGSHDRDHIGEDSRRRLLEILESDGELEGDGE